MSLGPLYSHRQPTFGESVFKLLGHVIGGAVLFLGLAAVSWLIGWGIHALDAIHPFNPSVFALLHGVEVAILYLDIGLSGIVLVVGAFRFIREIAQPGLTA
ncbi:hypothetical protein [Ramlibacter albus]|uniref:Uncharacterized protein n=1 Tax=Ramlibacter albus TaxID=2079448 RepID=A0A923S3P8_9BURK|nr:hypothetical protein [Ramlibacter albus]MBC5763327.1 hypothetical protein [Ramlibacter albus]